MLVERDRPLGNGEGLLEPHRVALCGIVQPIGQGEPGMGRSRALVASQKSLERGRRPFETLGMISAVEVFEG